MSIRCLASISLVFLLLFASDVTHALQACKAKVSVADGAIRVSAKDISGSVFWGRVSIAVNRRFSNESASVVGGFARNCTLGAKGTSTRVVPPEFCILHLRDFVSTCSIFIEDCTPGRRPDVNSEVERVLNGMAASTAALASASRIAGIVDQETGTVSTIPGDEASMVTDALRLALEALATEL